MKHLPKILCEHRCEDVQECSYGFVGDEATHHPLLFVLNYPDKRIFQRSLFRQDYRDTLLNTKTGMVLHELLKYCNLKFEQIAITNLFKGIYKTNKKPPTKDFRKCASILEKQIKQLAPSKIILFGHDAKKIITKNLEHPTLHYFHPSAIWAKTLNKDKRIPHYQKIKEFLEN